MNKVTKRPLGEVAEIIMGQSPESESYNEKGDGIPFYQGKSDFGEVYPTIRMYCNSPKKIAEADDILMSVRAPIGDVNIAQEECCIGRGLAAIRPNNKVHLKYLFYLLDYYKERLDAQGTGSTFKAIGKDILNEFVIPIWETEIQQDIVAKLNAIHNLIDNRKQVLSTLDTLIKSRFIEMFGDPVTNDMNWETDILKNLGELNRGVSKHRPRNAPELLGGPYPLVQTGDVSNADTYINDYSSTYSEIGLKQSRMWSKGTLCITIAANIAQTGILTFDACFPDSVVGFISGSRTNQMYMHYWFSFFQKILEEQAPQSAQKNINLQILSNLSVMVPPLELQEQFAKFVELTDKSKLAVQQSIDTLQTLKAKLMQDYFG